MPLAGLAGHYQWVRQRVRQLLRRNMKTSSVAHHRGNMIDGVDFGRAVVNEGAMCPPNASDGRGGNQRMNAGGKCY